FRSPSVSRTQIPEFQNRLTSPRRFEKGRGALAPLPLCLRQTQSVRYRCTWYCEDEITRYNAVFAWFFLFDPAKFMAVTTVCFIWLDIVPCNILLFSQSTIASWEPALYTGVKSSFVPLLIELFTMEFTKFIRESAVFVL